MGSRNGRAGSTTSDHSCPGVYTSRTWIQHAESCGSLRVSMMSHWTEPRVSSESQHSTSWPLSSLVPVSLKSQDLGALTQVLVPTDLVFQNLRWVRNNLLAPNDCLKHCESTGNCPLVCCPESFQKTTAFWQKPQNQLARSWGEGVRVWGGWKFRGCLSLLGVGLPGCRQCYTGW